MARARDLFRPSRVHWTISRPADEVLNDLARRTEGVLVTVAGDRRLRARRGSVGQVFHRLFLGRVVPLGDGCVLEGRFRPPRSWAPFLLWSSALLLFAALLAVATIVDRGPPGLALLAFPAVPTAFLWARLARAAARARTEELEIRTSMRRSLGFPARPRPPRA